MKQAKNDKVTANDENDDSDKRDGRMITWNKVGTQSEDRHGVTAEEK